jgi:hypothetical protein
MAPPPKRKSRGSSSLLNVFLPENDWRAIKTQFLKIVDKLSTLIARVDKLEAAGSSSSATSDAVTQTTQVTQITQNSQITQAVYAISAQTLQDIDRLSNPVSEEVSRVDGRNYETSFDYESLHVFRNGQEITSLVILDNVRNINFPAGNFPNEIDVSERVSVWYIKQEDAPAEGDDSYLTGEDYQAIQNLLNPIVSEPLVRLDTRNYQTAYKYKNLHIFRSGQEVTSLVILDGNYNVNFPAGNFPAGIGVTELITGSYVKQ